MVSVSLCIPPNGADMTREDALTMIIASIAMEELALSHILCRTNSAGVQCVLNHIGLPRLQLDPDRSTPLPTDVFPGTAARSPGQAAVRFPNHPLRTCPWC